MEMFMMMSNRYRVKVYLATPYTHKSKIPFVSRVIQWWRCRRITKITANLLLHRYNVFSPITHSHPISKYILERLDTHTFWLDLDFDWIDCCDVLMVYPHNAAAKSFGVKKEIDYASKHQKPVYYIAQCTKDSLVLCDSDFS
jgi:hypothetical protein